MKDKTNAIIISIRPYNENNELIKCLTADYGYLSFVVKGSTKLTAKNRLMPLTLYEFIFDYKENKTIFSLQNRNFIKSYYDNDLKKLAFLNILLELVDKIEVDKPKDLYADLIYILDKLNQDNQFLLASFLVAQILKYGGISPYTDGCVICNRSKVVDLSIKKGGFVCQDHRDEKKIYKADVLAKFRHINMVKRADLLRLKEPFDSNDFKLWMDFLSHYNNREFKMYQFYLTL